MSCIEKIFPVINSMIESIEIFKNREMYDNLSMNFIKNGVFALLIRDIVQIKDFTNSTNNKYIAKILELCACHTEGIVILKRHLNKVMSILDKFMNEKELIKVRYPAATVLLDLTANESCIETVA
jgi:hypothetical protein